MSLQITSLLPDNAKDIATAKALAFTPFRGIIGNVVFATFSFLGMSHIQTYDGMTRKSSARWVDHDIINGPPVSEFTGRGLDEMELSITLHSSVHFDPLSTYETLQKMMKSGEPQLVFLDGKNYKYWTVRGLEEEETHWAYGRPAVMKINVLLREYISSLPTAAAQALRNDELRRGDTGKGGPDRLPGTGESPLTAADAVGNDIYRAG